MPSLVYSNSDFVNGTTADADAVNTRFNDIKTLLNTTKLDSTNVQDGGLTRAKLASATAYAVVTNDGSGDISETLIGTAGQFLTADATATGYTWVNNPASAIQGTAVGSAAQVTSGVADYATIADAITNTSAGDTITVLPEYVTTENVTLASARQLLGKGQNTTITGTITVSANECAIDNFNVTGKITLSGNDNFIGKLWSDLTSSASAIADTGSNNFVNSIFLS